MSRTISQRLLLLILLAIAVVYLVFLGMFFIARVDAAAAPEPVATADSPFALAAENTLAFFQSALRGDLGEVPTVSGERPVNEILWVSYANSMGLVLIALVVATVGGVVAGSLAAFFRHRRWADLLLLLTILGVSLPSFLVAVLLQNAGILYSVTFGRRFVSMGGYAWDFQHLLLPVLVLGAWPLAYVTRATFLALSDILEMDYMRTALAKGLRPRRRIFVHAYRNLVVPVLTAVAVSLRFSLSSLPIVELIFAWPGVGLRALEAIQDRVPLLVVAIALLLGLTIQIVNLLLEVLFQAADPRLRGTA